MNDELFREIISGQLTAPQIDQLREHMLPFISFAVWIDVEDWLSSHLLQLAFGNGMENTESLILPMEREALVAIGLPEPTISQHWKAQYTFIPAITHVDSTEEQQLDNQLLRLPITERNPNKLSSGCSTIEVNLSRKGC